MPRLPLALVVLPGALVFAPPASAGDPEPRTLFGQPVFDPGELSEEELAARRAAFERHLEENDLIHAGGLVVPRAQVDDDRGSLPSATKVWDKPPHRQTIYLNFIGGMMTGGTIASEMESPCINGNVAYPGFKGSTQQALAIIQVFKDAAEPFGMRVAYDPPPPKHLPYSMVMMGGKPGVIGLPNGVLGVSCNLDCGEQWWRDTTFAFTEVAGDIQVLGTTALQEAAHSWGLDHIDGEDNIMYPYATFGKKVWADTCTPYNAATGPIGCEYIHDEFCGDNGGAQNDVAELTAYFGPNTPDDVAPTVTMISPTPDQVFNPGDSLHVQVEVTDNFEGYGWRLVVPELGQELNAYYGETEWNFPGLPKGTYTIRVEAIDHDRNEGFAEAKIYVGVEVPVDTSSGGESTGEQPTSGDASGATAGGSDASAGGTDAASSTAGMDGDDKGCNCATGHVPRDMSLGLLALGLLGLGRRRRR